MVSVSLNTAVVSPKAEPAKAAIEPIESRKGEYVKTPVSALEFQDFLNTIREPKDDFVVTEVPQAELAAQEADKTRQQQREDSIADFSVNAAATIPNPAAVPSAKIDLVSEPEPPAKAIPKVAAPEKQGQQQNAAKQADQQRQSKDSFELSSEAKKEVASEPAPTPTPPSNQTAGEKIEEHFNGLF